MTGEIVCDESGYAGEKLIGSHVDRDAILVSSRPAPVSESASADG